MLERVWLKESQLKSSSFSIFFQNLELKSPLNQLTFVHFFIIDHVEVFFSVIFLSTVSTPFFPKNLFFT